MRMTERRSAGEKNKAYETSAERENGNDRVTRELMEYINKKKIKIKNNKWKYAELKGSNERKAEKRSETEPGETGAWRHCGTMQTPDDLHPYLEAIEGHLS